MATYNQMQVQQKPKFSVAITTKGYQSLISNTLRDPARARLFTASITSAVAVNPALQECDAGTILAGALLGESLNLSPSPQLGQYYLVPFKQKAKYDRSGRMIRPESVTATFVLAFTLGGKQRVTLEINGDFREIWDKLHQEPVLDVEIKKHREKRSLSANAYFHVLCNKISAETGESEDAVKRRLVVSYGALARDKDGKPVGLKLPPTVDPSDFYPYVRLYETRQENGKDYSCYFVYKESHKMDSKEFARLVDGAIEEAKELGIQTDTPEQLARYKEEWSK